MEEGKIRAAGEGQKAATEQEAAGQTSERPWFHFRRDDLTKPFVPGVPCWIVLMLVWLGVFVLFGLVFINNASAATFSPPVNSPPTGNIPSVVWNRVDTTAKQAATAIDIDGGGPGATKPAGISVGASTLDLGSAASGQNVIWGGALYGGMNSSDYLLLLQTYAPSVWTNRLRVDRTGNLTSSGNVAAGGFVSAAGDVAAGGCLGAVFSGLTGGTTAGSYVFDGNMDVTAGYLYARDLCAAASPAGVGTGGHVCSSAEIMMSLKCQAAGTGIRNSTYNGLDAWIQDGPPGYTALANDCNGWQSDAGSSLGRIWRFDATKGGQGFLTTCNQKLKFACCK